MQCFNLNHGFSCDEVWWVSVLFGMRKWNGCTNMNCTHFYGSLSALYLGATWNSFSFFLCQFRWIYMNFAPNEWWHSDSKMIELVWGGKRCVCVCVIHYIQTILDRDANIELLEIKFKRKQTYKIVTVAEHHQWQIDHNWTVHYTEMQLNWCICWN